MSERYPKRQAQITKKESLSEELLQVTLKLESTLDLPTNLAGRHVKIFPFENVDYRKSYTISYHHQDVVQIDLAVHEGRASKFFQEAKLGAEVIMWGPKTKNKVNFQYTSDKVFLLSDASGYGTMNSFAQEVGEKTKLKYWLKATNKPRDPHAKVSIDLCRENFDLQLLLEQFHSHDQSYVVGSKDYIHELKSVTPSQLVKKIYFKSYWAD